MSPNVDLLNRTLAHIEANPREWEQRSWATRREDEHGNECGTAFCFAGRAVMLAHPDAKPIYGRRDYARTVLINGEETHIQSLAEHLLGLDYEDSDYLFASSNTLDDLRRIVGELTAGAEEATA